jgi:hypothetical protein
VPIIIVYSLANTTRIPAFRYPSKINSITRDIILPLTKGKGKNLYYSLLKVSINNSSIRPTIPYTLSNTTYKSIFRRPPKFESSSRDIILPSIKIEEGPYYLALEEPISNSNTRSTIPYTLLNTHIPTFRRPPKFNSPNRGIIPPLVKADLYSLSLLKTIKISNIRPYSQRINNYYRAIG